MGGYAVVFDPSIGAHRAWPGGPPVPVVLQWQAQEAARVATEQAERLRRAKEEMVGRCRSCGRAFCETHQSISRSEVAGMTTISRVATLTECRRCQDREFAAAVEDARAAYDAAEATRRAEQERLARERRDHEESVAAWEAETGWPQAVLAVLLLFTLLFPTVWAVWVLGRLVRRQWWRSYVRERNALLRLRGCGDPRCARCEGN